MKRARVLLADDHRMMAEGLKRLLDPEFELVGLVEDGRALVEAAARLKPDVIVADITMPRLNGLDAIPLLKKDNPDARIVVITMHRETAYARRALAAGASGFVLKSSAPSELIAAIHAALAGRTFVTPEIAAEASAADGPLPTDLRGRPGRVADSAPAGDPPAPRGGKGRQGDRGARSACRRARSSSTSTR